MPTTKMKDGREETTLVLDTFADVGSGELWVRWPVAVDEEAQRLFDTLVAHLGYLGRSESWVLGESRPDDVSLPLTGRAFPHSGRTQPGRSFEQIALSAPEAARDYDVWRNGEVEAAIKQLDLPIGRKPTPAQQKKADAIQGEYPIDLCDCLQRDTAWWQAQKWSRAPGMRSVLYWREAHALEVGAPSAPRVPSVRQVEMMLLAITSPSGSRSALPAIARTLPQAELVHKALVSKLGFSDEDGPCSELTGRDESGQPLLGHRHAHIVPIDLDRDGHLDHILVFAPMGLGARAQWAVRNLRRTYMKGGVGELQLAVAGLGALDDLRRIDSPMGDTIAGILGPIGGATSWISATPFVPPRHIKKHGRSSLEGQLVAECEGRGVRPSSVEVLEWTAETTGLRHFVRARRRGPQPPVDVGFAVRLRFPSPVSGPICLGYASHFGLGRFTAE
jgi:CRISPR-associated protein Csb2